MRNIAFVLAGGSGRRMGADVPKQFLPLAGREVIEYSIDVFDAHPAIDAVGVVVHADWMQHMQAVVQRNRWGKMMPLVTGGAERYMSSLAAIGSLGENDDVNILLHDAARPLIDAATVSRVMDTLAEHRAVAVAVPSVDTMLQVADGVVAAVPKRSTLWCAQTPQAFRLPVLRDAYRKALADPSFAATDDCGVVMRYRPDVAIHVVEGLPQNFKITHPDDMRRARVAIDVLHE